MMTIEKDLRGKKSEPRQVDDLTVMRRALDSLLKETRKNPEKQFDRVYEGGMIHKDGRLREEFFDK